MLPLHYQVNVLLNEPRAASSGLPLTTSLRKGKTRNIRFMELTKTARMTKAHPAQKASFGLLAVLAFVLSGCVGGSVNEIVARQCPPVDVLATADRLPLSNGVAALNGARLKCYINARAEDTLSADVTIAGAAPAGTELPIFLAILGRDNQIMARTQYKLATRADAFQMTLPSMEYGKKGDGGKPRLVVGFVLDSKQLEENRAAYRKQIGLVD